jgi:hypothetical protein
LLSGRGGQLLQAGAGVALGAAAAEQARVGAVGGAWDVAAGDVEQDDFGALRAYQRPGQHPQQQNNGQGFRQ